MRTGHRGPGLQHATLHCRSVSGRGKTTRASPFYNLHCQKRQGCFVCTLGGDLCVIGNRRGGGVGNGERVGGGGQVGRYLG